MLTWPGGQPERFAEIRVIAAFDGPFALASGEAWGAPWAGWVTYPCRVNEPSDRLLEEDTGEVWRDRFRGGNGLAAASTSCRMRALEWAC